MILYKVKVKHHLKELYVDAPHEGTGYIWQWDDNKLIWFKFITESSEGEIRVSHPCRYIKEDILMEEIGDL